VIAASYWVDELQRVFDREIQQFTCSVLGQQVCSTLKSRGGAGKRVRLRCHARRNPDS
jgi:hypothetical protein